MNAVVKQEEGTAVALPEGAVRRGITEPQWRTLMDNLYPGANPKSVAMVWDYCVARRLDPLKKPCHIVPMNVKDARTGEYSYRDVVMPGIYEYRTTAQRTGEYLGHSVPEYGAVVEYKGVSAPEWCSMTIYRWNPLAKLRAEFPVRVEFKEIAATKRNGDINERWSTSPKQMITKCTEAAGLREGFPDELGGTHTVEEMEGRVIEAQSEDVTRRNEYVKRFMEALDLDLSEEAKAEGISLINSEICSDYEFYSDVWRQMCSKDRSAIKAYIELHKQKIAADGEMLPNGRAA